MNRRRFLSFLGLAPVAAALPATALPRADNVKGIVTGEAGPEMVAKGLCRLTANQSGIGMSVDYDALNSDVGGLIAYSMDGLRQIKSQVPMYDPRVHDYKSCQAGNVRPK